MAYDKLLRLWRTKGNGDRCRYCRRIVVWRVDDRGRWHPLSPTAEAIRFEADDNGRAFAVYEPSARHVCASGFEPLVKQP